MKLMIWINREVKSFWLWIFLLAVILLRLGYAFFLLRIVEYQPDSSGTVNIKSETLITIIEYAFREELRYRLPLLLCIVQSYSWWLVGGAVLISSCIFGSIHGDITNIPLQGVAGLLYSIVFLKCGGLQGRPYKALFSSTFCHSGYNFSLTLVSF